MTAKTKAAAQSTAGAADELARLIAEQDQDSHAQAHGRLRSQDRASRRASTLFDNGGVTINPQGQHESLLALIDDKPPSRSGESLARQLRRHVSRQLAKSKIDVSRFTPRRRKLLQRPMARMPIGPEPWQARQGGVKDRPKGGRDRAPLVRLIILLSQVDVLQLRRHLTDEEMALVSMALGFWPTRFDSVDAAVVARKRYVAETRYSFSRDT